MNRLILHSYKGEFYLSLSSNGAFIELIEDIGEVDNGLLSSNEELEAATIVVVSNLL